MRKLSVVALRSSLALPARASSVLVAPVIDFAVYL
jgi:hypothetical protein